MMNIPAGNRKNLLILTALSAITVSLYYSLNIRQTGISLRSIITGERWLLASPNNPFLDTIWFPFIPITAAFIKNHIAGGFASAAYKIMLLPSVLIAFSIAAIIHSSAAGLITALITAGLMFLLSANPGSMDNAQFLEQIIISTTWLITAGMMTITMKNLTGKNLLVGLSFAIAIYAKSIILPFMFIYAAYSRLTEKENFGLRQVGALFAVPALALSAWAWINWNMKHEFKIIEDAERIGNIVTGAMGLTATLEGNWRALAGISETQNAFFWAITKVLSAPLPFLAAIPRRIHYILFEIPFFKFLYLFFLVGITASLSLIKQKYARPLILLISYFLALHLSIPAEDRYFVPLWFLLCPVTGIFITRLIPGLRTPDRNTVFFKNVLLFSAAPVAIIWIITFFIMCSFHLRAALRPDISLLENKYSDKYWFYLIESQNASQKNNMDRAVAFAEKASSLDKDPWLKITYILSLFKQGKVPAEYIRNLSEGTRSILPYFAIGLKYTEENDSSNAKQFLDTAMDTCIKNNSWIRRNISENEQAATAKMYTGAAQICCRTLTGFIEHLPSERKELIRKRISPFYRECSSCQDYKKAVPAI